MSILTCVSRLRTASVVLIASAVFASACGSEEETSFLHPSDTAIGAQDSEINFTPTDALIDNDRDFTDGAAIADIALMQRFFDRTPYGSRSFLASYASNGVSAASAVLTAALKYQINPIVLIARLQMAQGLVSATEYPEPSTRVEYAFECGCNGATCLPETAGLDRQLECLAARFNSYMQQMNRSVDKMTDGGWGPNIDATTIDGVVVTPPNQATAAIYQFDPYFGEKDRRGAWLFYRLYARYSRAFQYSGTIDPLADGKWIGGACTGTSDCSTDIPNVVCLTNVPGGYCTGDCTATGTCPSAYQRTPSFCGELSDGGGGRCVGFCNPASPNCRDGYQCAPVQLFDTAGTQEYGCIPL